ncbi:MAG: 16S rRNA (cytosine(1402)-N(4))-methyltransferase RsmH [Peptococcaceae bacterium]|jgi:16S rRNA (cytosine1402-N4)-methyltransferase|nr:16S rRNA (cytosine(1402)-N(4))-methyltransferase RsmH [Peptococcaceae bacterium]MBQ2005077.1 16S rRNA (cytosine(1402)-N(4))-methyltransferase RsmH [Peptococcaceae bacterium]MBQ2022037.1 16S rRNA (cytosine(1402)-N(4))-methyltransferase RsmH [Peptococcaceae bacterium]MBQ2431905.1 16S rRNA (cytosine(1402)-N(4))-methyltransferase RsmH [Peptococcaceae bacterium]MBQ5369237.1 16S rRNA (cytosine(1402)-N(4))-methyltransferase RsmH [Peptococcaceae bacterium]
MEFKHIPVLFHEIMDIMAPQPGEVFVDCTLGGGGHSRGFLERMGDDGRLIGIDQDTNALQAAGANLAEFGDRVTYVHSNYNNLDEILNTYAPDGVDGILFDIGVSSHQLDEKDRGFSYMQDAPLDMRMNQSQNFSAWDVVNTYSEEELHRIIKEYGEERWAKRVAQFIVEFRKEKPVETTGELVDIIKRAIPKGAREEGSHPAKRTFQAIRIEVNDELGVLTRTISVAAKHLKKGGRLGIISFHSLEDRIVKEQFRYLASDCICPPELPFCQCDKVSEVKILTRKPVTATKEELEANSRSKSAKFRAVVKIVD